MAYTTIAVVRAATGFNDVVKIPDTTITAYIADADSVIDAKICDVYSLPLSSTPEILETIARHIVVGLLYSNEYGEESQDTDKGWRGRLDWAMSILEDIQKQKTKLYTTAGVELSRSSLKQPRSSPNYTDSALSYPDSKAPLVTRNMQF